MIRITAFIFVLLTTFVSCQQKQEYRIKPEGREEVSFKVIPFSLSQVDLLEGPFKHATELNKQSLLNYKPDRFLADFRAVAGLEPKAEDYHGWEDETLAGHSLGHYLSACSMMYKTTGDSVFLERVNYIVDELGKCQRANGGGFIGAVRDTNVRKIFEDEIAKGEIRSMTIDFFQPGEMQPERNHNFIANNSRVQERQGRKSRIVRSGWISFDMEVEDNQPVGLAVEYWTGVRGKQAFDIFVDGIKIAEEDLSDKPDGEFIDVTYDIPDNLTSGKEKITVQLAASEGHVAGPVYGVRTIKRE